MRGIPLFATASILVWVGNVVAQNGKENIFGEWEIVQMVFKGENQDFGAKIGGTIKLEEGKFWINSIDGNPGEFAEFDMVLRPSKNPKEIDVDKFKGIYELKGDSLVLVIANASSDRPKNFDANKDDRLTLYRLKKKR
jgi:uncharacterized protein (TIGR03067 family)